MNKILRLVCRQADFKKIVSIGFFAAFFAVFLSTGTTQASFFDWFNLNKANNNSQQAAAIANAETATYNTLTVAKSGSGSGVVETSKSSYNFNSDGATCYNCFKNGTIVNLVAKPDSGSSFAGWTGCDSSTGSSCKTTMNQAKSVTVNFNTVDTAKILKVSKTAGGAIASSDGKINCGLSCDASYSEKAEVTLTATPDTGYKFTGWANPKECVSYETNSAGNGICSVRMSKGKTLRANFKRISASSSKSSVSSSLAPAGTFMLKLNKPTGGTITSNDSVINCGFGGAACDTSYTNGTEITLTAAPSSGWMFNGWNGWKGASCSETGGEGFNSIGNYTCKIKINKNTAVNVGFSIYRTLTVNKSSSVSGSGMVKVGSTSKTESNECKFDVSSSCQTYVPSGTKLTLTAVPSAGSSFAGWSGNACAVSSQDKKVCAITLNSNKTVSAIFKTQ